MVKILRLYLESKVIFDDHDQVNIIEAIQFKNFTKARCRLNPAWFYFELISQETVALGALLVFMVLAAPRPSTAVTNPTCNCRAISTLPNT